MHILHLSAASALPLIAAARADGVRVTAETCPHYLTLTAEEVPDGATQFKCCPPIRDAANRDALWRGLADGTIDCVVSDHSPCPPDAEAPRRGRLRRRLGRDRVAAARPAGDVDRARPRGASRWPTWCAGWRRGRPRWPGWPHKGRIEVGHDADLVAFDPRASSTVDPSTLHHRHPVTPYAGRRCGARCGAPGCGAAWWTA